MTGQPFVRLGSWRPWQHCGAAVPLVILTLGHRIHATVNGPADDVSPGSAGVTLESVIGFGIIVYQIGWSPPRPDFSFAGGCDSFLGDDPLLLLQIHYQSAQPLQFSVSIIILPMRRDA